MPISNELLQSDSCSIFDLEQRFQSKCSPTLGSEIELGIVDRQTKMPRNLFREIRDRLPSAVRARTQAEFLGAQIEFASKPHARVGDMAEELRGFVLPAGKHASKFSSPD